MSTNNRMTHSNVRPPYRKSKIIQQLVGKLSVHSALPYLNIPTSYSRIPMLYISRHWPTDPIKWSLHHSFACHIWENSGWRIAQDDYYGELTKVGGEKTWHTFEYYQVHKSYSTRDSAISRHKFSRKYLDCISLN